MRVMITLHEQSQPELYRDLTQRASRYRPERIRALAAIGLMALEGRAPTGGEDGEATSAGTAQPPVSAAAGEEPVTEQPSASKRRSGDADGDDVDDPARGAAIARRVVGANGLAP